MPQYKLIITIIDETPEELHFSFVLKGTATSTKTKAFAMSRDIYSMVATPMPQFRESLSKYLNDSTIDQFAAMSQRYHNSDSCTFVMTNKGGRRISSWEKP